MNELRIFAADDDGDETPYDSEHIEMESEKHEYSIDDEDEELIPTTSLGNTAPTPPTVRSDSLCASRPMRRHSLRSRAIRSSTRRFFAS